MWASQETTLSMRFYKLRSSAYEENMDIPYVFLKSSKNNNLA
jgi:hypothetical protein